MLRIKKSALSDTDGILLYQDKLYTGIAYSLENGKLLDASEYQNGLKVGTYSFEYFSHLPKVAIVDTEILEPESEDDYESFQCIHGKRFSGVALEFDGNACTGELLFIKGWSDSQVTYFQSGSRESLELIEEGFSQIYQWYECGKIKKFEVSAKNLFSINLTFNSSDELTTLGIEGDYFSQIKNKSRDIIIPSFTDKKFVEDLKAGKFLSLSGSSIDDTILEKMFYKGTLDKVQHIILQATTSTEKSLNLLRKLENLNRLDMKTEHLDLEDAKRFKSFKGDCYVEFNGQEINF